MFESNPFHARLRSMSETKKPIDISTAVYTPPPVQAPAVTVKKAYGGAIPPVPSGYEVIDFRPHGSNDVWLSVRNEVEVNSAYDNTSNHPRLILRKIPVLTSVVYTVVDRDRTPKKGEFYLWRQDSKTMECASYNHDDTVRAAYIFTREEVYS